MKLKELAKGGFFRLKDSKTAPVWVRGDYVRGEKKYSTYKYDDANHERLISGDVKVFTEFELNRIMKVYVVQLNHGIDNIENLGIFSTRCKAEIFAQPYQNQVYAVDLLITEVAINKATSF